MYLWVLILDTHLWVLIYFSVKHYVMGSYLWILIGYSTVFCKIRDFICTSLRSTEIVLDER